MKPKTKVQIEVNALSATLPKMVQKQKQYAFDTCFSEFFYKTKDHITCMRCGHKWADKTLQGSLLLSIGGVTCPKCKKQLRAMNGRKRTLWKANYIYSMTTLKNFQVLRFFHVTRTLKAGQKAAYSFSEVFQHWIREDGKHVIMSQIFNAFGYNDHWGGGELEVRPNKNDRFYIHASECYPGKKLLKVIRRNGYRQSFHGLHPAWFFELILSEPKAETLLKAKQFELFKAYGTNRERIAEHWASICICMRNNYIIKDTITWFDHLRLLRYFGKDLRSVKYICPDNLSQDHLRLVVKKGKIDDKIAIEQRKKQIAADNKKYIKEKQKFFDICLTSGQIRVIPLKSIEEFINEGKVLKHCVYVNNYYEKKNSLIMSARKGSQILETVEVDLIDMEVRQSRGLRNSSTRYHDQIVKLVKENIPVICQIN